MQTKETNEGQQLSAEPDQKVKIFQIYPCEFDGKGTKDQPYFVKDEYASNNAGSILFTYLRQRNSDNFCILIGKDKFLVNIVITAQEKKGTVTRDDESEAPVEIQAALDKLIGEIGTGGANQTRRFDRNQIKNMRSQT